MAAKQEADELIETADGDGPRLDAMVERRLTGEPLAWITGSTLFCGLRIQVWPGVYVPRWQSEPMARLAASRLPPDGVAVDLCTGAGAIAAFLQSSRPTSRVVATELDAAAADCAAANGVEVYRGDLDGPLPPAFAGAVDVMTAVVPYVPEDELRFLPRDVVTFEPRVALDGGPGGLRVLARAVSAAARWLRPGGTVLLEIGGDQAGPVTELMTAAGLAAIEVVRDSDGDTRAISARTSGRAGL